MTTGNGSALSLAENGATELDLLGFARWLYSKPEVIEVWGLEHIILADVECSTVAPDGQIETQAQELDSGTWLLVRVAALPDPPPAGGIIAFRRAIAQPKTTKEELTPEES